MFEWVLIIRLQCKTPNGVLYKADPMTNLLYSLYCQKHLDGKFEVADFKYDNSFSLKLQPKNT